MAEATFDEETVIVFAAETQRTQRRTDQRLKKTETAESFQGNKKDDQQKPAIRRFVY